MSEVMENEKTVPFGVSTLILGILSLLSGCMVIGLVLGIVGVVLASNGTRAYRLNPSAYKGEGMLRAGKILSILGIVFGGISLVWAIVSAVIIGGDFFFFADLLDDLLCATFTIC